MQEDLQQGTPQLCARCSDVDAHRIDVAAGLLAHKPLTLDVDGLLARTAAETRRRRLRPAEL